MVRHATTGGSAGGRNILRACIINHRTRDEDIAIVLAAVRSAGVPHAGNASTPVLIR